MKKTHIAEKLEALTTSDIYSLILFAIYKLKDTEEYSVLSELAYILDQHSLLEFLDYFGGMTIKVPTKHELQVMLDALLLYEYINIENIDYADALQLIDISPTAQQEVEQCYLQIIPLLKDYDFRR